MNYKTGNCAVQIAFLGACLHLFAQFILVNQLLKQRKKNSPLVFLSLLPHIPHFLHFPCLCVLSPSHLESKSVRFVITLANRCPL